MLKLWNLDDPPCWPRIPHDSHQVQLDSRHFYFQARRTLYATDHVPSCAPTLLDPQELLSRYPIIAKEKWEQTIVSVLASHLLVFPKYLERFLFCFFLCGAHMVSTKSHDTQLVMENFSVSLQPSPYLQTPFPNGTCSWGFYRFASVTF